MDTRVDTRTPAPDDLVARWRAAALAGGWRAPGDWAIPAVGEVAAAAAAGSGPAAAARRLGAGRARCGVGAEEGLADLVRPWELLGRDAPAEAVLAFAAGWAEEAAAPAARPALDPATGLVADEVLRLRLADLLRAGDAPRGALVCVDVVDPALPRFARHLEAAAIGRLVLECFASAESPARLPDDRVAAIVVRGPELDEGVVRLRRALQRRDPDHDEDAVRVSALPGSADEIDAWLAMR